MYKLYMLELEEWEKKMLAFAMVTNLPPVRDRECDRTNDSR